MRPGPEQLVFLLSLLWLAKPATWVTAQTTPATLPDLKLSTAGTVNAVVAQDDGKVIIGGSFTAVNDLPFTNLARLNPNGSVDLTWSVPSPSRDVFALAVNGTELFVGGSFSALGTVNRGGLAKVNLTEGGAIDPVWNPANGGLFYDLAVVGGQLYVGGSFFSLGGASRTNLARVSTSGSGAADPWNPNPNGRVDRLVVSGADVFVGGSFTTIGGQVRSNLAKLSASGSGLADTNWRADCILEVAGISPAIRSLAVSGTNLFVAGAFSNVAGATRQRLAKLSTLGAGTLDTQWTVTAGGNVATLVATNGGVLMGGTFFSVNGLTRTNLARVSDSGAGMLDANWRPLTDRAPFLGGVAVNTLRIFGTSLYAGGTFHTINGAVSLGITKLDPETGLRDAGFAAQAQVPGRVLAMARQDDGRVIVGGDFWFAAGLPRQNLARINTDGSLDATWSPEADGRVLAIALTASNAFVGGEFITVNGTNRNKLAKIDVSSSDAVDPVWSPAQLNLSGQGTVQALALEGTNLFVGGNFLSIMAVTRNNLAKVSTEGTGALDTLWRADAVAMTNQSSASGFVFDLVINGGDLFLGGNFGFVSGAVRKGLAKVATGGPAVLDPFWNPGLTHTNSFAPSVYALAQAGTNLYIAGFFSGVGGLARGGLARVSLDGNGPADPIWNPNPESTNSSPPVPLLRALALNDTNVFFSGNFNGVGGVTLTNLARVTTQGTGAVDAAWSPSSTPLSFVAELFPACSGVLFGGGFTTVGGARRNGFAFLPIARAPLLVQDTTNDLVLARHPDNGREVTHFRITAVSGGTLRRRDGVTPIAAGSFLTFEEASAGLKLEPGGTVSAVSALNNTPAGAGTETSSLTMLASPPATSFFSLSSDRYSAREGDGAVVVTVRKLGAGAASVDYATSNLTAAGGVDYQSRTGRLDFVAGDKFKNVIIAIADDFQAEGDETFSISLSFTNPPPPGAFLVNPTAAIVTLRDNDITGGSEVFSTTIAPAAPPVSTGVLQVSLQPTNANGQWRLPGEVTWHNSSDTVSGLANANYQLEFRPVTGYRAPETLTVPISAGMTNAFTFTYALTTNLQSGSLTVVIEPGDVATNASLAARGQWHLQGEAGAVWRDSGERLTNLGVGNYTVEFKPLPGRIEPPMRLIEVGPNGTYGAVGTYLFNAAPGSLTNEVVPFAVAVSNAPYLYNGQLQTSVGFSSGFVVRQRVALTVAHALFDDVQLSYSMFARWFFQRYRGRLEPVPQSPRGWYVFEGYAGRRQQDNSPGISTPASQNLDAAALFFLEDAGRGGLGGYLSSDADNNEFLLSANNKFLVGYPLDGVNGADQGKLHASTPANLMFRRLYTSVFATTNVQGFPGNSGGPLYVQADVGKFLPAAIYLGGSGETLVRAINSEVVDLINRADVSGNGGGNSTGGGVTLLVPGITARPFDTGLLTVRLGAAGVGGWRIARDPNTNFITNAEATVALETGGDFLLEFLPVSGLLAPTNRIIRMAAQQVVDVDASYTAIVQRLLTPAFPEPGHFQLSFTGIPFSNYVLEAATSLKPPITWLPLTTNPTDAGGGIQFTDALATNFPLRFYRVRRN